MLPSKSVVFVPHAPVVECIVKDKYYGFIIEVCMQL